MKDRLLTLGASLLFLLAGALSCESIFDAGDEGSVEFAFIEDIYLQTRASNPELPDTNKFKLKVTDSKGSVIYDGLYGSSPQTILANPGTYYISVRSGDYITPAFAAPRYGDDQQAVVKSGQSTNVQIVCRQLNAGIRLRISPDFLTAYPNASMHLKSDAGKLMYAYSETRFAYFPPGKVNLVMSDSGKDVTLLTRDLSARDMLTLDISVAEKSGSSSHNSISIAVDTTLNRIDEKYVLGGTDGKGSDKDKALSVNEARGKAGAEDVWVYGYIVGGDLSSSKASFKPPFTSKTNIVIASKASTTDKNACMSVQLQKGEVRDALNLVDNPSNHGIRIFLRGNIVEAYYGIPGIQDISEFSFE